LEDRIGYYERMLVRNPENPMGLLALANEYEKAGRFEDEADVLTRYISTHEDERTVRQRAPERSIGFRAALTGPRAGQVELVKA
jgi:hypothetical protein